MGTSLECKIVVGCMVGGEEEDHNNHGSTSWEAETWKKIWQNIDIFGVWEWMDGSWLCRSYIYIIIITVFLCCSFWLLKQLVLFYFYSSPGTCLHQDCFSNWHKHHHSMGDSKITKWCFEVLCGKPGRNWLS